MSKSVRVKSVVRREDTVLRYGGSGDNWHMSWAFDDRQYLSLCDGVGFVDSPKELHNSRMLAIDGGPQRATFHDLSGYPTLAIPAQRKSDPRYFGYGTLALDGYLYQFLSTFNRPNRQEEVLSPGSNNVLRFNGAKLIYSPDSGLTWHNQNGSTPVVWEAWDRRSKDTMVFFQEDQEAFSLLSVLQMGKNYEHNRDGYVYVYAPNGNTEGTMNELVMFRVRKNTLLDRGSYEYFAGRISNGSAKWSKDINARAVVHTYPRGWVNTVPHPYAWQPSVVYNSPLGVYMMANWGTSTAPNGMWFHKPNYLGFWTATNPWGPWTQIYEESSWLPAGDKNARAYQPQIAPKWISKDGKSLWLVWSDFQITDEAALARADSEYRSKRSPGQEGDVDKFSLADVMHAARNARKYMPYYAFNVQRVDLVVA